MERAVWYPKKHFTQTHYFTVRFTRLLTNSKLWPLTRKHSERLAVLKLIAVHQPFERTGMPFERLKLSVLKNSSSVRTVRAIRSRKLISHSNSSSYPFEKNHQPFEQLKLSIREIHQPFEWLKLSVREIHEPFEWLKLSVREIRSRSNKTRLQNNSPFFVQWCMPLCLHYTNSRHVSVLCLSSFNFK